MEREIATPFRRLTNSLERERLAHPWSTLATGLRCFQNVWNCLTEVACRRARASSKVLQPPPAEISQVKSTNFPSVLSLYDHSQILPTTRVSSFACVEILDASRVLYTTSSTSYVIDQEAWYIQLRVTIFFTRRGKYRCLYILLTHLARALCCQSFTV